MNNLIVISIPPEEIQRKMARITQELSSLTGSTTALKYPPHVTLRTGFLIPQEKKAMEGWRRDFASHLSSVKPAMIQLDGILLHPYIDRTTEEKKYFFGLKVVLGDDLLAFHRQLLAFTPYRKRNQGEYHPHLSLCYGDLSKEGYEKIEPWLQSRESLRDERGSWLADEVVVCQEKEGKWEPWERFKTAQGPEKVFPSSLDSLFC